MTDQEIEAINRIKDMLGEHFTNFSFAVVTEEGGLYYDYRDRWVGKALMVESVKDIDNEPMDSFDMGDFFGDDEFPEFVD